MTVIKGSLYQDYIRITWSQLELKLKSLLYSYVWLSFFKEILKISTFAEIYIFN